MSSPLASYLFVIDSSQTSISNILSKIDEVTEIENWQMILPDAIVLVSNLTVQELNARIRDVVPKQRFIVTVLERGKKQGWLTRTAWNFINKPAAVDEPVRSDVATNAGRASRLEPPAAGSRVAG